MDEPEVDRRLDELLRCLPEPLRSRWAVVPKRELNYTVFVAMVIGAAIALTVVGFVLDHEVLAHTWPLALAGLVLLRFLVSE